LYQDLFGYSNAILADTSPNQVYSHFFVPGEIEGLSGTYGTAESGIKVVMADFA